MATQKGPVSFNDQIPLATRDKTPEIGPCVASVISSLTQEQLAHPSVKQLILGKVLQRLKCSVHPAAVRSEVSAQYTYPEAAQTYLK